MLMEKISNEIVMFVVGLISVVGYFIVSYMKSKGKSIELSSKLEEAKNEYEIRKNEIATKKLHDIVLSEHPIFYAIPKYISELKFWKIVDIKKKEVLIKREEIAWSEILKDLQWLAQNQNILAEWSYEEFIAYHTEKNSRMWDNYLRRCMDAGINEDVLIFIEVNTKPIIDAIMNSESTIIKDITCDNVTKQWMLFNILEGSLETRTQHMAVYFNAFNGGLSSLIEKK